MAILSGTPTKEIIDGFKGTIDFYYQNGQWIARSWPRTPHHPKTPEQVANWQKFAYINKLAPTLPPEIIEAYKYMALGSKVTWKDMAVIAYMHGIAY